MAGSLLDRFDESLDKLFAVDKSVGKSPHNPYKWWVVITSTMTHLVITDQQHCITIAPTV